MRIVFVKVSAFPLVPVSDENTNVEASVRYYVQQRSLYVEKRLDLKLSQKAILIKTFLCTKFQVEIRE